MNYNQSQFSTPAFKGINRILIDSCVVLFVLQSSLAPLFGVHLESYLGLSLPMLLRGHFYQLISYPFMQFGLMGLIFNCLLFWLIGSELESLWGRRTYLEYLFSSVIGGAISFLFLSEVFVGHAIVPLLGLNGLCSSLLVAYAVLFSERQLYFFMLFPLKAKYFCMIIIVIELYMAFFSPGRAADFGNLGSMLFGFGYLKLKSAYIRSKRESRPKKSKSKAGLYLVKEDEDEDSNGPKYWQ